MPILDRFMILQHKSIWLLDFPPIFLLLVVVLLNCWMLPTRYIITMPFRFWIIAALPVRFDHHYGVTVLVVIICRRGHCRRRCSSLLLLLLLLLEMLHGRCDIKSQQLPVLLTAVLLWGGGVFVVDQGAWLHEFAVRRERALAFLFFVTLRIQKRVGQACSLGVALIRMVFD